MTTIAIGSKVRFSHPTSNGGTVHFSARVVKIEGDHAWVEMPERARRMPFPPIGGKRYGKYLISKLISKLERSAK